MAGAGSSGRLVHMKTKEECRQGTQTVQVWTVELPSKHAEGVLKAIKDDIPGQDSVDLQHLRRFAKPKFLPLKLLRQGSGTCSSSATSSKSISPVEGPQSLQNDPAWVSTPFSCMLQVSGTIWEWSKPVRSRSINKPTTLHLLVCPTSIIARDDLEKILVEHPPFSSDCMSWAFPLAVREVTVPLLAPTSPSQADEWTREFWPTFYRKTNPFGAHPSIVTSVEEQLFSGDFNVEHAMALAARVGKESKDDRSGNGAGCVVVQRTDINATIVTVASDSRYHTLSGADGGLPNGRKSKASHGCQGNVAGHPAIRAIGMVGKLRLRLASQPIKLNSNPITDVSNTPEVSNGVSKSTEDVKLEHGVEALTIAPSTTTESTASKSTDTVTIKALPRQRRPAVRTESDQLMNDERARNSFFLDLPITSLEKLYFADDTLKPDGYLCLDLEIYITHEPCVMCCMAIVHSRFGRCVFGQRMPETGGLTAEMEGCESDYGIGLGYGLPWRRELNWKFLCWQYVRSEPVNKPAKPGNAKKLAPPRNTYGGMEVRVGDDDDDDDEEGDDRGGGGITKGAEWVHLGDDVHV